MKKIITNEEKYAFAYQELTSAQALEISNEMNISTALYEEIAAIKAVKAGIDNSGVCPKIKTLKNILAYSRHTH